jgi:signal recognition particle receptor subunit beta
MEAGKSLEHLKKDFDDVPVVKIVFWGASMAGKTMALTIFKVLKTLENPDKIYSFLTLDDPTKRTLFFDRGVFGFGYNPLTGKDRFKAHIYTVPGQIRHITQREVVTSGTNGIIAMVDSQKAQYEANVVALKELAKFIDKYGLKELPFAICLNKLDLPAEERISSQEFSQLLVKTGWAERMQDAHARVVEMSCLDAKNDLVSLIKSGDIAQFRDDNGRLKKEGRPDSVKRVILPIEMVLREVLTKSIAHM